jgi:hypothetical protein
MPVILVACDPEVGGLYFQTSPSKKLARLYLRGQALNKGMVVYACNLSYQGSRGSQHRQKRKTPSVK